METISWVNTKEALKQLLRLCECAHCHSIAVDPCSFHGKCYHNFCRLCANKLANENSTCLECGEVFWLKDLKSNHRLQEAIPICMQLEKLIGDKEADNDDERENNDEISTPCEIQTNSAGLLKTNDVDTYVFTENVASDDCHKPPDSQSVDFERKELHIDHQPNVERKELHRDDQVNVICIGDDTQELVLPINGETQSIKEICNDAEDHNKKKEDSKETVCKENDDSIKNKVIETTESFATETVQPAFHFSKSLEKNVVMEPSPSDDVVKVDANKSNKIDRKCNVQTENSVHQNISLLNEPLAFTKSRKQLNKLEDEFVKPKPLPVKTSKSRKTEENDDELQSFSQFSNALTEEEISQGIQKNPSGINKKPKTTYVKSRDLKTSVKSFVSNKRKKLFNPQKYRNDLKDQKLEDDEYIFSSHPQEISTFERSRSKRRRLNSHKQTEINKTSEEKEEIEKDLLTDQSVDNDTIAKNFEKKDKKSQVKSVNKEVRKDDAQLKKKVNGKKPPRNLNKKNKNGETPLHVACIKGKKDRIEELLSFGAEVNTKDNNGWTPLHEACSHGFTQIVELLVEHGAIIDCVGGDANDTPLHDAVSNGRIEIVRYLLEKGAPTNTRNIRGLTAEELAVTSEMKNIFKEASIMNFADVSTTNDHLEVSFVTSENQSSENEEKILFCSNLSSQEMKAFKNSCKQMDVKTVDDFQKEATHLICGADEFNVASMRTMKYMFSLLTGKWIVNIKWLTDSATKGCWLSESDYEIMGTSESNDNIPRKARFNRLKALPKLFDGCSFYLRGNFSKSLSKDILRDLIKTGGGKILLREPKAEISDPLLMPVSNAVNKLFKKGHGANRIFHAQENPAQICCSEYVIYEPALNREIETISSPLLYTAPTLWLLDCVSHFKIVEIKDCHYKIDNE